MIDKIDTAEIIKQEEERLRDCQILKPKQPTPYEITCIDKVNELVDKFNEVFPI